MCGVVCKVGGWFEQVWGGVDTLAAQLFRWCVVARSRLDSIYIFGGRGGLNDETTVSHTHPAHAHPNDISTPGMNRPWRLFPGSAPSARGAAPSRSNSPVCIVLILIVVLVYIRCVLRGWDGMGWFARVCNSSSPVHCWF